MPKDAAKRSVDCGLWGKGEKGWDVEKGEGRREKGRGEKMIEI